jgi:multiple sugar transport system ATP-binding protein
MAEIEIKNLRKEFGEFVAVQDSTFKVEDGEFFMLLGPSGCGKTTTLRMMAGLELPTSGQILIDGEDVSFKRARERDIAFVFQMYALYPHLNVRQNLEYPLKSQGFSKAKIAEVAAILKIEQLLNSPVGRLSGGDRQRVALGRAIVRDPCAFFMDEPLGALDSEFREEMAEELRALHDRMRATTIYVTHDQLEAMQMGDKIVVMNHGVIEQFGVPQDIYDWPATKFVADFIGSPAMNFLSLGHYKLCLGDSVVAYGDHQIKIPNNLEAFDGDLDMGVRPEHVTLSHESEGIPATVLASEYLGTTQIVSVQVDQSILKARVSATDYYIVGSPINLVFDARNISLFDHSSGKALRSDANQEVLACG